VNPRPVSRREMFRVFFGRRHEEAPPPPPADPGPPPAPATGELALILDRFCLAHQGSFCTVCIERCPEPGAILTENGKPCVVADLCTGCRVCHDVCPAPKKAVFFVSRKPRPGMIGKTVAETTPVPPPEEASG
jgi:Pyruvate/2-oxoacid:ferredoxin oxidoreductase delta subunit